MSNANTEVRNVQLLIGGKAVDAASGETFDTYNPATNEVIAKVAKAGTEDVDRAVAAARKAFDEGPWPGMPPYERGRVIQRIADIIRERADEIARLESLNSGKPLARSKGEVLTSAMVFDYYAGAADKFFGETIPMGDKILDFTLREPVGVCAQIVPWNFPFMMAVWKVAPALAAGCTLILKPASHTPLTAVLLGEICYEAGVPEGVVNVLPGPGAEIGDYLSAHPQIDKIAFTGETATGARILKMSADTIKKVSLELGGKSPNIIFADADIEQAAAAAVPAGFGNSGQVCTARTRVFVASKVYDNFMSELVAETENFKVGDPFDPSTLMGPVISRSQWDRVTSYVQIGREEGAELVYGGTRPSALPEGNFIHPTIFAQVSNDMRIAREEIFGPVLAVIPYDDVEDAVRIANDSDFGLAGSVWTSDQEQGMEIARRVRTGTFGVNQYTMDFIAPFGGFKASGIGREFGKEGLEHYLELKSIVA